jgi:hypothetical protein
MNKIFHTNISIYAGDKKELYKIWDDDLKKINTKRGRWELALIISTLVVILGDTVLLKTSFIGVSIIISLQIIKHFIEEAHVNYLMHKIDMDQLGLKE